MKESINPLPVQGIALAQSQIDAAVSPSYIVGHPWTVLFEIKEHGRVFRLRDPLFVSRWAENGYIFFEDRALSILAFGQSEREAIDSFQDDFGALWDMIASEPDGALTPEAQAVKAHFHNIVDRVVAE